LIIAKIFSLNSCSAGLSGIIFSILVVDVSSSLEPTQNVLGLFMVPTAIYPWVLLVMMSVIMPDVSFVGHLCGIVSGYLYSFGLLNFIVPSYEKIAKIDAYNSFNYTHTPVFANEDSYNSFAYSDCLRFYPFILGKDETTLFISADNKFSGADIHTIYPHG